MRKVDFVVRCILLFAISQTFILQILMLAGVLEITGSIAMTIKMLSCTGMIYLVMVAYSVIVFLLDNIFKFDLCRKFCLGSCIGATAIVALSFVLL